ncbi:MAG: hypothetical protein GY694_11210 [Gammaproteobacteria bacterium]|nr:hypothetical protein [Gammaproteobacteria bacterium]
MLNQFRQIHHSFGRTLLGMLLFVWLSMAISPCVMANSVVANNSMTDIVQGDTITMEISHANMDDCEYCPDNSMNTSLCQSLHNLSSDSMVYSIEPIDTKSFILFEIPVISDFAELQADIHFSKLQLIADIQIITPLALTGILRI